MLTALVVKKEGISCECKLKYKLITLRTRCYLTNFKICFFFAGVMKLSYSQTDRSWHSSHCSVLYLSL